MSPHQFVETKYKVELNAATNTQLSKAIISGAEKGVFVLPKGKLNRSNIFLVDAHMCPGPSGKVKLAPKAKADVSKETKKEVGFDTVPLFPVPR